MKFMFFNFPMGATWRLFGSVVLKPRKEPLDLLVMFLGTSVRMTWPLTFSVDSNKVKDGVEQVFMMWSEFLFGFGGDIFQ